MQKEKVTKLLDEVSNIVNDHCNNLLYKKQGVKLLHEKFAASIECSLNLAIVILKAEYMSRRLSKNGENLLIVNEAKRNKAYKDIRGFWTIGIGHLIKPDEPYLLNTTLNDTEIMMLFRKDISHVEDWININCKWQPNQNQFDALCSFLHQYNINKYPNTRTAFIRGDLVEIRHILANDFNHADVTKRDGTLKARRQRELALFNKV